MVIILYLLLAGSVGHPILSQLLYGLFGGSIGLWSIYLTLTKDQASEVHKNLSIEKTPNNANNHQLNNNEVKKHKYRKCDNMIIKEKLLHSSEVYHAK